VVEEAHPAPCLGSAAGCVPSHESSKANAAHDERAPGHALLSDQGVLAYTTRR